MRLEFACGGFLSEMRRQDAKQHPADPMQVKALSDYSPGHQSALMAAIQAAINYAGPEGDKAFAVWLERRAAAVESETQ